MDSSQPLPPARPRSALFAIGLGVFVGGVGNSFVFAVLPPLGRELGLSEIQIGSIATVSAFVFMITAPWWGARSEHWGRRRVILFGQSAYGITTLLFALTIQLRLSGMIPLMFTYVALVFFRALFTACISGIFPASQAYIADVTSVAERTRAMAIFGVSMGLGMITGPALAALFSTVSLVFPFYAVIALSLVSLVVTLRRAPEPVRHRHAFGEQPKNGGLRIYVPFLVVSIIVMCTMSALQQASGFYFQDTFRLDAQTTAQRVGVALMASAVASVCAQMFVVRRLGWAPGRLLRVGAPIAIVGVAILVTAHQYPMLVIAMAFFGLGQGMMMPGNIAALSMAAGAHEQGRAAGVNTSAQGFGFMLGPMIGSAFYTLHPLLPYWTCLGLLLLLAGLIYFVMPHARTVT